MAKLFTALIIVTSLLLITAIMLQPSKTQGIGLMTGIQETFYSKNKTRTRESFLAKVTVVLAILFALSVIGLNLVK